MMMRIRLNRFSGLWACLLVVGLAALFSVGPATRTAEAQPEYFSTTGLGKCAGCHAPPTPSTCNGCHSHGTHPSSAKNSINVAGATNKASYAPGEQVSVTITGGYQSGWIRAILYNQTMTELARSTGTATGGMGGGAGYPITLTAPAPTTPGTYTWNVAWYGNKFDLTDSQGGTTFFGPRWTPDPNNANHGREIVSTNSFTVAAAAAPAIQLNPASLAFGTVTTGSTATLTTQIQNTGTATLNVTGIAPAAGTSSEYTFKPAAPLTIPAGGNIVLSVTYTPVDAGTDTGSLAITSNAATSPTSLALTGTGSVSTPPPPTPQPAISLSLASLDFGTVTVGGVPAVRTTQIQNTGTAALNVTGIARAAGTSAEYTFTPAAPFTVAAGANTTLTVTYTPVDAGTDTGSLAITSNASSSPTSLALTGTGSVSGPPPPNPQPTIGLTPTSLDFGTVAVGGPSGDLTTTIQNTGAASLEVTGIALCAGTSGEFTWSPGMPLTVAPGGNTTLNVHYTPVDAGTDAGCLTIASNDPATPSANLAVTGIGSILPPPPNPQPAISLTPTSLDFGTVVVGGSISKTTTITNLGTAPLDVTGIGSCNATSAEFTYSPLAPFTLAPGAKQTLTVSYAPTQAATDTGCLTIASNDPVTPSLPVNVTATGVLPPPPGGLDVEIKHFYVTEKVRIGQQVKFKLDIDNEEDSSGQAPATLVGIQNGVEVYNQTITVFVEPELEEATWSFPPYTPTA
ncbi:MAG: choice-of-anchor D domain-containing protein, partial [Candidatus Methylomirabilis oxyfera]|nr:choice-of-anchor D domain-containing protein [Candidatus Methylomirabilis oxyfera]